MGIFDFFKTKKNYEGIVEKYNLVSWWQNNFSKKERKYIISKAPEMVKGRVTGDNNIFSAMESLYQVSTKFDNEKDFDRVVNKLLNKAIDLAEKKISLHYELNEKIKSYYKKRNKETEYLKKAISACKKQIDIAEEVIKLMKKQHFLKGQYNFDYMDGKKTLKETNKDRPYRPVSHKGYKQLAIIRYKQGEFEEVIKLCKQAKKQGWKGDWDKRIERAKNQL